MRLKFLFAMVMALAFSLGVLAHQQDDSGIKQVTLSGSHRQQLSSLKEPY